MSWGYCGSRMSLHDPKRCRSRRLLPTGAFATNFYGEAVYNGKAFSMGAAFLAEFLLTAFFLIVIMGATDRWANGKFAGIAIGLALTLIHLISIPITNTSVNPARSLSQAVFTGGLAMSQLWLFWVAQSWEEL